jgi:hypothetical protein
VGLLASQILSWIQLYYVVNFVRQQQENEELLRELCGQVKGVVVPVTQAIEMMSYFRSKSVLQRTSFRGFFEVSQFVKIPVWAFKKTAEMKLPTLAKVSKVSQECKFPMTRFIALIY